MPVDIETSCRKLTEKIRFSFIILNSVLGFSKVLHGCLTLLCLFIFDMFRLRQTGVGEPQSQLRNKSCIHSGRWRPKLCFVAFWFMICSFVSSVITRRDSIIPLKQSDFMLESHKSKRNKELPAFLLYSFSNHATGWLQCEIERSVCV